MSEIERLNTLAARINEEHRAFVGSLNKTAEHGIRAGELLSEAKAQCPHGTWLTWLEENFEGAPRTAQEYMRLYNHRDEIRAKTRDSAHLSISGALREIAEPKDEMGAVAYPTPADARAMALLEKRIAGWQGLSMREPHKDAEGNLSELGKSEKKISAAFGQIAEGAEMMLETVRRYYEVGEHGRARGWLRETLILNNVEFTGYREALREARDKTLEFLTAKQAATSNDYLGHIADRVEERQNHTFDTVAPHLTGEERSLLREVYPEALARVRDAWEEDEDVELALEALEEVVCPRDVPPSREWGGFKDSLTDKQMRTPFAELRRSGELYEALEG